MSINVNTDYLGAAESVAITLTSTSRIKVLTNPQMCYQNN